MLNSEQKRKVTGVGLIVIGVLFLLVSNNLWLGWGNVWPLFPILAGMLFLRVYARNRTPEILFGGGGLEPVAVVADAEDAVRGYLATAKQRPTLTQHGSVPPGKEGSG